MAQPTRRVNLRSVTNDLPSGRPVWCGPAVVSAITGKKLSAIMQLIKDGRVYIGSGCVPPVKGTGPGDLIRAFRHFGYRMVEVKRFPRKAERPTLARWLRERTLDQRAAIHVVDVSHWVAVRGKRFADSWTGKPVWLRSAPHRRRRVKKVFRIERI